MIEYVGALVEGPPAYRGGLVEVAPGTFAWLQPNGDWGESNAGLIVGDGESALVDTAWDLRLSRRLIEHAQERAGHPVTQLLATHADGDHVHGAQLLPAATMFASDAADAELALENPAGLRRSAAGAALLAQVGVGAARRFGGYVDRMLSPYDFSDIRIRRPDRTFTTDLTIAVGGREVRLEHLGPAHTAGDAIVHLADVGVVFSGDLVFNGVIPNSWAGAFDQWRSALDRIAQLDPAVVVPGHGETCDLEVLATLDRYLVWLQRRANEELGAGQSVDEAAFRIVTGDDGRDEPWSTWRSAERTVASVLSIDRARRGLSPEIRHRERPRVLWRVAALAHRLRERDGR